MLKRALASFSLICGLLEFVLGNTFPFVVFTTYSKYPQLVSKGRKSD